MYSKVSLAPTIFLLTTLGLVGCSSTAYTLASKDDPQALQQHINNGGNPNKYSYTLQLKSIATALHNAAQKNDIVAAQRLLAAGADVDVRRKLGGFNDTPLYMVVLHDHYDMITLLLNAGANPELREKFNGSTPLALALMKEKTEIAQLLLNVGANPDAQDKWGNTPLHNAAHTKKANIVRLLIEAGADTNAQSNQRGETPLHYAVIAKKADIVQLLIEAGANTNAQSKWDQTPLHYAAVIQRADIVRLLIEAGADTSAEDKRGKTPLDYARQSDIVQALITPKSTYVAAQQTPLPANLATTPPVGDARPLEHNQGTYISPFRADGSLAVWVDLATNPSTTAGARVGKSASKGAGSFFGRQLAGSLGLGSVGDMAGSAAGSYAGGKLADGATGGGSANIEELRPHANLSFNDRNHFVFWMKERRSRTDYPKAVQALEKLYPNISSQLY